jgi:hypothetical protein
MGKDLIQRENFSYKELAVQSEVAAGIIVSLVLTSFDFYSLYIILCGKVINS